MMKMLKELTSQLIYSCFLNLRPRNETLEQRLKARNRGNSRPCIHNQTQKPLNKYAFHNKSPKAPGSYINNDYTNVLKSTDVTPNLKHRSDKKRDVIK